MSAVVDGQLMKIGKIDKHPDYHTDDPVFYKYVIYFFFNFIIQLAHTTP